MSRSRGSSSTRSNIKDLVRKLFKAKPTNDLDALNKVRSLTNSKMVAEEVFAAYKERKDMVERKGQKFANLIRTRYSSSNLPFNRYYKKALKYKKKYGLNDEEFDKFFQVAITGKSNLTNVFNLPNTNMSRTLGYSGISTQDSLRVRDGDLPHVQAILKQYSETKPLHFNVTSQSLTYRSNANGDFVANEMGNQVGKLPINVTNSQWNRDFVVTSKYSYVHPLVVALYAWKLPGIEKQTIIGSIGYIIKCKQLGRPIATQPDYDLYWSLISDPNDIVCDMKSPMADLKNRFDLQCRLWDSVMNLREGRAYNDNLNQFLLAVDNCRVNLFDAPDLSYVRDEGTTLRRILSAFSVRPTVVSSTPIWSMLTYNPHFTKPAITQVTTIPLITFRLPHKNLVNSKMFNMQPFASTAGKNHLTLNDALQQSEWFVEGRLLVPKSRSLLYSKGVLIFNIVRRFHELKVGRTSLPYTFNHLPMTVSGLEALNDLRVRYGLSDDSPTDFTKDEPELLNVGYLQESFKLVTAVVPHTQKIEHKDYSGKTSGKDFVTRVRTVVFDYDKGGDDQCCLLNKERCHVYDPQDPQVTGVVGGSGKGASPWTTTNPRQTKTMIHDTIPTQSTVLVFMKMKQVTVAKADGTGFEVPEKREDLYGDRPREFS
jgi:hypothetical protein